VSIFADLPEGAGPTSRCAGEATAQVAHRGSAMLSLI
jgi:hypothetical protein